MSATDWSDVVMSELPTGTVSLLLADVEGSTMLWETQADEMTDAVAHLDRTLSDLLAGHGGVRPIEQGEGDSFVVAFARASDAVEFALELQRAKSPGTHGLPMQLTSFVGRKAALTDIRQLATGNRLVTLTGAGGAGKTRLAGQVAEELATEFADGAWYVDLAPITDPDVVPVAVARALGLPDQPGLSMMDTLTRLVANRQMLVVLDNCEHLLDACATLVADLLGACPGLRLLTTSREPIAVAGEATFLVPSLSLADEAIELFTDRARLVRPDFEVTAESVADVTEICRRLDGMPLAIELAAPRVRSLSLEEIVDSLHDRFRLLTGDARTAVRRQQTLRASVDWSHAFADGARTNLVPPLSRVRERVRSQRRSSRRRQRRGGAVPGARPAHSAR